MTGPVDRDRDRAGRPRNSRPRDELGRPLPPGRPGVERADEGVVRLPADSLATAQQLLAVGRPFHAHEVLEDAWKSAPPALRELWRGLAQLAVGLTHAARDNPVGTASLLRRGAESLAPYAGATPDGVAVDELITWAQTSAAAVEAGSLAPSPPTLASPRPRIVGLVLAAGAGQRMGGPKAELVLDGVRLVDRAVAGLRVAGCPEVIAVVRPGGRVDGARVVVNDEPERGLRSSLLLGVAAATGLDAAAVAVVLVDTPGITAEGSRAVLDAWRPGRIAIGRYSGQRGHPTVMEPQLWRRAVELAGPDEGARALLRAEPALVDDVPVDGDPGDLDTPADLGRWQQR
jgi:CTP:molybdopterin cytidylyltransferase MocA